MPAEQLRRMASMISHHHLASAPILHHNTGSGGSVHIGTLPPVAGYPLQAVSPHSTSFNIDLPVYSSGRASAPVISRHSGNSAAHHQVSVTPSVSHHHAIKVAVIYFWLNWFVSDCKVDESINPDMKTMKV